MCITLVILSLVSYPFVNSVYPGQLASDEAEADQDSHFFSVQPEIQDSW